MGYPMAGHLAAAGHEVRVFNRTSATSTKWVKQYRGVAAATPREAASGAAFVFVCVGADADVRAVIYGDDGALAGLAPGAVVVDHTTASASLAEELHRECAAHDVGFVDAPISGGQAGAENGTLSVMCGGDQPHFDAAAPVIDAYAAATTLVGPAGSGQRTKMVNQILCAGAIQGAAEALAFGRRAGLDMERVFSAVTKGAAASWYLQNRGETMLADEFDFGFAVDWMAKDLGLVHAEAERLGAPVPLTELTAKYLAASQAAGDSRRDATAIIRRYRV
jgi:3-hydroxyisobutyrate dehydrogenase-like beta-hydroxyacid dehydrogenase